MATWMDADSVTARLSPGDRVYVGGSANEPRHFVAALRKYPERSRGVTYVQQPLAQNEQDFSALHPEARQQTFFITPATAAGFERGTVAFVPMQMRAIYSYLSECEFDLVLLAAARDRNGVLRFGPNVDYVEAAMARAKFVAIEVSRAFVAPLGGLAVDETKVHALVATDTPVLTIPSAGIDDTSARIGRHIASVIRDGDCLQTGIGAVPAAVMAALADKNDLGFHGGLIDDAVVALIRAGNMNGNAKAIDRNRHVTGMALGSNELHEFLAQDASVVFRGAGYTHEITVIAQIDNFVSINSAVEVDVFGQVNAEVVGGKQISGTGGSVDFMRSARVSRGGRSIVALSATARRGAVSRIVPKVEMVTALRTDVDLVVTEFGVADLRTASLAERRQRLIDIAHPDFQDALR